MANNIKFNVVVLGVSCFDGMASSMRVRNLLGTSIFENALTIHNLIYKVDAHGLTKKKGNLLGINYLVVSASSILSVFSFTWQGLRFLKKSKSASEKNILYHYQYIDIKNIFLLLFARILGYKIILDIVENNNYYTSFTTLKNRLKIATSLRFLRLTPFLAHYVVTISEHLKELMTKVCKNKIPVVLIPITVDLNKFKQIEYSLPTTYKIFYGGSFGVKDGMENLIGAFGELCKKHQNVQLILTGRASQEDFGALQSYLKNSSAKDKIVHLGFLNDKQYYETLNSCHIFCMTRTNSKFANAGFPFKLGEFLSTGKAVIATNVGDIPIYLKDKENALIINPDSRQELFEALDYLLNNPSEIKAIGQKGRLVAENHFDTYFWSTVLRTTFEDI